MSTLTLTKHHGLGNDFLVVFHPHVDDLPALAQRLREHGVSVQESPVGLVVSPGPGQGAPLIVQAAR